MELKDPFNSDKATTEDKNYNKELDQYPNNKVKALMTTLEKQFSESLVSISILSIKKFMYHYF